MPARRKRPTPVLTGDPIGDLGRYWAALTEPERRAAIEVLDAADLAILERARALVTRAGWRATPATLGERMGLISSMPHTDLLANKFVDAVEGRSPRQIWNMPPQHGKSLVASQLGPAWALDRDPTTPLALTSYGDVLATRNSRKVRDILRDYPDLLDVKLKRGQGRQNLFETEQGGGLISGGVGSALTGFPARGIVIDDPHKNWAEAHSEAKREAVWNWYRSTVRSRLWDRPNDPGWIIVVQTRWHEDDLTGKLLAADEAGEGEGWELVRLPAIAEAPDPKASDPALRQPDPLGRAPGEPLAPLLYDIDALLRRAKSFGAYLTAGLEQQRPAPEEGTDIMRGWWEWYTSQPPKFDNALASWDVKLKDKKGGDFVVGQAWGRTGPDYWCVDQLRGQWNYVTTKTAIVLMAVRHPEIRRHVIENTGNGPEAIAELRRAQPRYSISDEVIGELGITEDEIPKVNSVFRRGLSGIVPENPKGDKRARMRAYTPLIEAGNVHVPDGSAWAEQLVNEAAMFPNGTHDDAVDAMSQALKKLSTSPARAKASKKKIRKPPVSSRTRGSGTSGRPTRGATTRTRFGRR